MPRVPGLEYTAPVYDEVTRPEEAPVPVACLVNKSKGCKCYSQQATLLSMDQSLCRQIVANGYFRAFSIKSDRMEEVRLAPGSNNVQVVGEMAGTPPVKELIPPQEPMMLTPYKRL